LQEFDCVIVPSGDGGYSMIGFSADVIEHGVRSGKLLNLFTDIQWSTDAVLDLQLKQLQRAEMKVQLLDVLPDIDDILDLAGYLKLKSNSSLAGKLKNALPQMAMILPVYNEEESLPGVLDHLPLSLFRHVVVADNGSDDDSVEIARRFHCHVTICRERGYG